MHRRRNRTARPLSGRRPARLLLVAASLVLLTSGCTAAQWGRGGWPTPVTVQGKRVLQLWQGSLLAALIVGAFVGGLIVWASIWYRQRGNELPRQVRYNLPIEVVYTIVPCIIVGILFYFTAIDETYVDRVPKPDMTVGVVGFQWSWQFNYVGQNLQVTGRPGQPPQLVLPTGKRIRFILTSADVDHAFWVVPFLFKRDVIPGHPNEFEVTITRPGTFAGKCTEYCGLDHDRMLFSVKAVPWAQYQAFLASARSLAGSGSNPMYATSGVTATTGSTP